tara:strand:- start:150 stop:545 length:396 start_codon:yes stop_codon:yes gene_type:complete
MKKITLILFALIFISISSCKKDETNTPTELIIASYPTSIGSEWKYKRTSTYVINDTNSLHTGIVEAVLRIVTIEKDSTINGINVVKYTTTSSDGASASFKRQTWQGIYTHAYFGVSDADLYLLPNSNNSTK